MRQITLTIAPATETTCEDGTGHVCPLLYIGPFGGRWECSIWKGLKMKDGWVQRHSKCLEAETTNWQRLLGD